MVVRLGCGCISQRQLWPRCKKQSYQMRARWNQVACCAWSASSVCLLETHSKQLQRITVKLPHSSIRSRQRGRVVQNGQALPFQQSGVPQESKGTCFCIALCLAGSLGTHLESCSSEPQQTSIYLVFSKGKMAKSSAPAEHDKMERAGCCGDWDEWEKHLQEDNWQARCRRCVSKFGT